MHPLRRIRTTWADLAALRAADRALHQLQHRQCAAGIRHETREYLRRNATANRAAARVSRWLGGTR